jgi:ACT domain-containing protein
MRNYKITEDTLNEVNEDIKSLDTLLTERISKLHEVKGMQQCRHAYIYYRSLLYKVRDTLDNNIHEMKPLPK